MPKGHAKLIRELVVPVFRGEKIIAILGMGNKPTEYTHQDIEAVSLLADLAWEIAERKRAEDELRKHRDHLEEMVTERTSELAAINQELEAFSYSVSHDLRAPLRAISGFSEIIASRHKQDLSEEGKHYFDNIIQASSQMDQLILDLLRYSRLGRKAIHLQQINLSDILDKVTDSLAGRLAESKAQFNKPKIFPTILGEQTLLMQIFTNLFENAITYRLPEIPLQLSITCKNENDLVIVGVKDNGVGISSEYHDKIFNVFQRLHSQDEHPGTGIGLAIVKKSVDLLGGKIWVESQVGKGSTFYIKLMK